MPAGHDALTEIGGKEIIIMFYSVENKIDKIVHFTMPLIAHYFVRRKQNGDIKSSL